MRHWNRQIVVLISALVVAGSLGANPQIDPAVEPPYYEPNSVPEDPLVSYELNHPGALDSRLIDWDGDGDKDIFTFFPAQPAADGELWIRLFENRLNEATVDFQEVPTANVFEGVNIEESDKSDINGPYTLLFTDVNGDGDRDMIIINQLGRDIILSCDDSGPGGNCKWGDPVDLYPVQTSDYIWTALAGKPAWWWECGANLGSAQQQSRWSVGAALGHLDRLHGKDLVVVYRDSAPRVFLNDPMANPSTLPPPALPRGGYVEIQNLETSTPSISFRDDNLLWPGVANRAVKLADLDGDGDLDCIIARSSAKNLLPSLPPQVSAPCLQAVDINGFFHDSVLVYENLEFDLDPAKEKLTPWFEPWYRLAPGCEGYDEWGLAPGMSGLGSPSWSITVRDVNGDTFPDIVVPVQEAPTPHAPQCSKDWRTRVYYNEVVNVAGVNVGSGFCGRDLTTLPNPVQLPIGRLDTYRTPNEWIGAPALPNQGDNLRAAHAALQDVNGDGLRDMVLSHNHHAQFAGPDQRKDRLWIQQSLGGFVRGEEYVGGPAFGFPPRMGTSSLQNDFTRYVRMKDLDGDGKRDCVLTHFQKTADPTDPNSKRFNPLVYIHVP